MSARRIVAFRIVVGSVWNDAAWIVNEHPRLPASRQRDEPALLPADGVRLLRWLFSGLPNRVILGCTVNSNHYM